MSPAPSTIARESATVGRRRSPSISVTGCPPIAMAAARFAAIVDLPSDCFGLVTTMMRGGLSTSMKARLVRSLRNASAVLALALALEPVTARVSARPSSCRM